MNAKLGAAMSVAAMLLSGTASATIIGQQFTAQYRYPNLATPYGAAVFAPTPFTAGPGLDTTGVVEGVTSLLVDLYNSGLTVTFDTTLSSPTWGTASFNGIVLTDAGPLGVPGATVDASSTLAGFDASRVTLTSNEIQLNWEGLSYQNGTVLSLSFTQVPEPASLALLAAGLVGLGLAQRRRTKA